jgi:hypothetical protein
VRARATLILRKMTQPAVTRLRLPEDDAAVGAVSHIAGGLDFAGQAAGQPAGPLPIEIEAPPAGSFRSSAALNSRLLGVAHVASATIAVVAVLALFGKNGAATRAVDARRDAPAVAADWPACARGHDSAVRSAPELWLDLKILLRTVRHMARRCEV